MTNPQNCPASVGDGAHPVANLDGHVQRRRYDLPGLRRILTCGNVPARR
jgi:hypothetical protein